METQRSHAQLPAANSNPGLDGGPDDDGAKGEPDRRPDAQRRATAPGRGMARVPTVLLTVAEGWRLLMENPTSHVNLIDQTAARNVLAVFPTADKSTPARRPSRSVGSVKQGQSDGSDPGTSPGRPSEVWATSWAATSRSLMLLFCEWARKMSNASCAVQRC
jgi:hypothetical protein